MSFSMRLSMAIGIVYSKRSKRALGGENYLEDMTSAEDEEESEPREICPIPQRNKKTTGQQHL